MYLTCNPGGVGHRWVKRLFIDRDFKTNSHNPEENENPDDYTFIPATVEDNEFLMKSSPGYLRMLSSMPDDLRRAYRYGDWEALGGNYFPEVRRDSHMVASFKIPKNWVRYRAIDYGLDMLACCWVAVDENGRSWVYRELKKSGLIVTKAAALIRSMTLPGEEITATFAPPDLWSRQKDTGKTMAELFALGGVVLSKAENDRVQGHMVMKDMLSLQPDGKPGIIFFDCCQGIFKDICDIQADEDNPSDCAKEPHGVTHGVDAVRYYCVSRTVRAEGIVNQMVDDNFDNEIEYSNFMGGGEVTEDYLQW
jgi:phage terminase large subunit